MSDPLHGGLSAEPIVLGKPMVLLNDRIEIDPRLVAAMKAIARGRTDCGHPLSREVARQVMRTAMASCGMDW